MAIPDFQTLMRPVLALAEAGEVRIRDAIATLADQFELTEDERRHLLPSGRQTTFANRVHWAKTFLAKAGLVSSTRRGHFVISDRGRRVLAEHSDRVDMKVLNQFEEYRQFREAIPEADKPADSEMPAAGTVPISVTPDESLRVTVNQIEQLVAKELLDRLMAAPPKFFENAVVQLLRAMGYGGTRIDAGRVTGGSGDGGIDGVIDQDPLGLDRVYIQAKRYALDNGVGESEVRGFVGALAGKQAAKGVFVTTSRFTTAATKFVQNLQTKVVLIDGDTLAALMIRHDIGVRTEQTLHVKKLDEDFFDDE